MHMHVVDRSYQHLGLTFCINLQRIRHFFVTLPLVFPDERQDSILK
jgi:hypothetical protein